VYTNQDTAQGIREALQAHYKNTEQWGLTTLTEKFNNIVKANQSACPDIWLDSLQYYKELIVKAGGSAKTDAEIVAHVLATAPNNYDSVTTLILGKDLKDKETLKFAREQYRSYWKQHFEHHQNRRSASAYGNNATAYTIETKDKHEVNAIGSSQ
jgi:lysine/ornithine N-monooxygenase